MPSKNLSQSVELVTLGVAILSLFVSVGLTVISQRQQRRIRDLEADQELKTNEIRSLKGTKEDVNSIAFKYLREGLPDDAKHKTAAVIALVQAAIFEKSDRARGMVYGVLQKHYQDNKSEVDSLIKTIEENTNDIENVGIDKKHFDTDSGRNRINALKKVLE